MKKILPILLLMSSFCFAGLDFIDKSESNYYINIYPNLSKSWDLYSNGSLELGIQFLSSLINDQETSNITKIHYLFSRANFYAMSNKKEEQAKDMGTISEMVAADINCRNEFNFFYNREDWICH